MIAQIPEWASWIRLGAEGAGESNTERDQTREAIRMASEQFTDGDWQIVRHRFEQMSVAGVCDAAEQLGAFRVNGMLEACRSANLLMQRKVAGGGDEQIEQSLCPSIYSAQQHFHDISQEAAVKGHGFERQFLVGASGYHALRVIDAAVCGGGEKLEEEFAYVEASRSLFLMLKENPSPREQLTMATIEAGKNGAYILEAENMVSAMADRGVALEEEAKRRG